jgi:PKD repeat protein
LFRTLHINLLICTALLIFKVELCNSQNTPVGANHLLSVSEGILAPFRIAIKNNGSIYVTDIRQKSIIKLDDGFNVIGTINLGFKPTSIAINSLEEVFVGDYTSGLIYKLDGNDFPTLFTSEIEGPASMVFDQDDNLYVVDSKVQQITVFNNNGDFIHSIGAGKLIQPVAITYNNDHLYISEHGGIGPDIGWFNGYPLTKIWIFDKEGNEVGEIGEGGADDGEFYRIQGTNTSMFGTFYAVDPFQAEISIFSGDGTFLDRFGEFGTSQGKLNMPMDIAFDSKGRALVTSMNTGTLEVFYVNELNPTYKFSASKEILCPGDNINIRIDLTGTAPWTFSYTVNGKDTVIVVDTYSDPYIINTSDTGHYEVISLNDAMLNAVDYSNSIYIQEIPFPTSTITSGDIEICPGTEAQVDINFTGLAPYRFTYTDGITPVTVYNYDSSTYSFTTTKDALFYVTALRDANGCNGSEFNDSALITVNSLPSSTILSGDTIICQGDSADIIIEFTGVAPWTFIHAIDGVDQGAIVTSSNPYTLKSDIPGVYTISSFSDASVSGTCLTGNMTVTTTPVPTASFVASELAVCKGDAELLEVNFTGSGPWDIIFSLDSIIVDTITDIISSPYHLEVNSAGLYEITSVIGNNCPGFKINGNTLVSGLPLPTVNLSEDVTICENSTTDIIITPMGTAPWDITYEIDGQNTTVVSTSSNPFILSTGQEGTYTITEISDALCSNSNLDSAVVVSYFSSPGISLTEKHLELCDNDTGFLQLSMVGEAPFGVNYTINEVDTFLLNTRDSEFALSVAREGGYQFISISDSNCSVNAILDTAFVKVHELPTVTFSPDVVICEDETTEIILSTTGVTPWAITYEVDNEIAGAINSSSTLYSIFTSQEGNYKITEVTDAHCTNSSNEDTLSVIVNAMPDAVFDTSKYEFCAGDNDSILITLSGNGPWELFYNIDNQGDIALSSAANMVNIPVDQTGKYSLSAINDVNCSSSVDNSANVIIHELPDLTFGADATICSDEEIDVFMYPTGVKPWTFTYEKDGMNPETVTTSDDVYIIYTTEGGIYGISSITDANCTNNTITDTNYVYELPSPTASFINTEQIVCVNTADSIDIQFTGNGPWAFNYKINEQQSVWGTSQLSTFKLPVTDTGNYVLTSVSDDNCSARGISESMEVVQRELPASDFNYTINELEVEFENISTNATSFYWDFGDNTNSIEVNPIHTYQESGIYQVALSAGNDYCGEYTIYKSISVITSSNDLPFSETGIQLYPNPAQNVLTLDYSEEKEQECTINIINSSGQVVMSLDNKIMNGPVEINIGHLQEGLYIFELISDDIILNQKLIISR